MVDLTATEDHELEIRGQLQGEIAIVVTTGQVETESESVSAGQMLVSKTEDQCSLRLSAGTRLLLFGGEAFPEPRYLRWNFAHSSKERLNQAVEDWKNHKFPKVPGDETYVPLP